MAWIWINRLNASRCECNQHAHNIPTKYHEVEGSAVYLTHKSKDRCPLVLMGQGGWPAADMSQEREDCISHFTHCCDKKCDKKQLKGGRVWFTVL